jgi:5-bromo-4-chloroindolyl phosphate hydrolysis protein
MDNIIETDKLSIAYDKYCSNFIVTMYDKYGHYIDETELTKEDIGIIYKGLDEIREKILK